jgi:hypothetical protein
VEGTHVEEHPIVPKVVLYTGAEIFVQRIANKLYRNRIGAAHFHREAT